MSEILFFSKLDKFTTDRINALFDQELKLLEKSSHDIVKSTGKIAENSISFKHWPNINNKSKSKYTI
jgi:hypothetical protein